MAIVTSPELREKMLQDMSHVPGFLRKGEQTLMEFDCLHVARLPGKRLEIVFSYKGAERFTLTSPCRIPRGGRITVTGITGTVAVSIEP